MISRHTWVTLRDMPRPLRLLLALIGCTAILGLATPTAAPAASWGEKRLIAKINDARAAYGLRRLHLASRLNQGAHDWAAHLLRADSFSHARLAAGTGEILAWGTCNWVTPRRAVRMWLASASHRPILLRSGFRYVGAGWVKGRWRGYSCVKMAVARFR